MAKVAQGAGKRTLRIPSSSCWRARWLLSVMLGLLPLLWAPISQGQTTSITSSGLNTNVALSLGAPVPTYNITGGTRPGNGTNLFHSFGDFSVGTHDRAVFQNDSGLATMNILSRVTGGQTSNIYGAIQTAGFGAAALWLINPAGIVFGPSSSLNVGGSVHFSTADYLRLGNGNDRFYADLGKTSQLTSAAVTAFGFLGSSHGRIDVKGELLQAIPPTLSPPLKAADGHTISLIGGDISIQGRTIQASGGQINLVSVSAGEVSLTQNGPQLSPGSVLGNISLTAKPPDAVNKFPTHTELTTNVSELNSQAGDIFIRSGQLVMDDSSISAFAKTASGNDPSGFTSGGNIVLTATSMNLSKSSLTVSTIGNTAAGSMTLQGQDIILQNNTNLRGTSNLFLSTEVIVPTGGRAGTVTIEGINGPAQNVTISNSAINTSIATAGSPFSLPADIRITSQGVTLRDHAHINASSSGEASSGNIGINTNQLTMTNGAMISSNSTRTDGAAGGAGAILIGGVNGPATNISLDNSSISTTISGGNELLISSGNIHLTAQAIRLANGARITADTNGDTSAGSIILNVSNLATSGGAMVSSSTTSAGASAGSAGELVIQGAQGERSFPESITLDDSIFSITSKGGDPGHISILGRSISLENGTHIEADTSGGGSGGNILFQGSGAGIGSIATTNFAASNGVRISTNSTGTADAGNVSVVSGNIFIRDSTVSTSATQTSGGDIMLTAPNMVRLVGANLTSSVNGPANSNGGNITIDTAHPQFVILQGNSQILAKANAGQGGAITIIGAVVLQEPGSVLDATAGPAGISGSVNIQAPFQQLSGAIAPLPQAFAVATNLYGQRCAAEKGGQFSSFVQGARDGVPPQPGDLIPSPLMLELDEVPLSTSLQSTSSLSAIRLGLPEFEQSSRSSLIVFAGCRS